VTVLLRRMVEADWADEHLGLWSTEQRIRSKERKIAEALGGVQPILEAAGFAKETGDDESEPAALAEPGAGALAAVM